MKPIVLEGQPDRLEPLSRGHIAAVCEVGLDEEIWRWNPAPVDMLRHAFEALGCLRVEFKTDSLNESAE